MKKWQNTYKKGNSQKDKGLNNKKYFFKKKKIEHQNLGNISKEIIQ